jgi:hypothetical protein
MSGPERFHYWTHRTRNRCIPEAEAMPGCAQGRAPQDTGSEKLGRKEPVAEGTASGDRQVCLMDERATHFARKL